MPESVSAGTVVAGEQRPGGGAPHWPVPDNASVGRDQLAQAPRQLALRRRSRLEGHHCPGWFDGFKSDLVQKRVHIHTVQSEPDGCLTTLFQSGPWNGKSVVLAGDSKW